MLQGARDRRVARLDRFDRWVDVGFECAFELGDGVAHRLRQWLVEVEQDQPLRQLARGGRVVPGRDHGDVRLPAQRRGKARALPFYRPGRAAQEHRERRGVAEVLAAQLFPPRRGSPPDRQRGRLQMSLDPEADDPEHDDDDQGRTEDRDSASVRRRARPHALVICSARTSSHRSLLVPLQGAMKAQRDVKGKKDFLEETYLYPLR